MLYLLPLFNPTFYLLRHPHGRGATVYAPRQVPLARISKTQFSLVYSKGLLRQGSRGRYFLNRQAVRSLHGSTKLKRLYLQWKASGAYLEDIPEHPTRKIKYDPQAPQELGGLFSNTPYTEYK